ncbi:hypothetical protein KGP36_08175, partial [Patescibacteria group bacterium]|nr:hypothetical protein [Patescibacteria group bacterium]
MNDVPEVLHPWTVMIKAAKSKNPNTPLFFVTEIEADSEEEAIAEVLLMGYCLPRDFFELTAKRVPMIQPVLVVTEEEDHGSRNESIRG